MVVNNVIISVLITKSYFPPIWSFLIFLSCNRSLAQLCIFYRKRCMKCFTGVLYSVTLVPNLGVNYPKWVMGPF